MNQNSSERRDNSQIQAFDTNPQPSAKQPAVTIVIPAKDQENYIFDALFSLKNQGFSPSELEVIVVDDASTDRTVEIASDFAQVFGRFLVISLPENLGVSAARNVGIDLATGGVLCFLDPDDWYGPGFLRHCVDALHALDVDFVRTDHTRQFGARRELHVAPEYRRMVALHPLDGSLTVDVSTMLDYPFPPTGVFARSLFDQAGLRFNEDCATAEDREFLWQVSLNAQSCAVVSEPGFFYRRGIESSLTAEFTNRQLGFFDAYASIFGHIDAADVLPEVRDQAVAKAARQFLAIANFHVERVRKAAGTSGAESLALESFAFSLSQGFRAFFLRFPFMESALDSLDGPRRGVLSQLRAASNPGEVCGLGGSSTNGEASFGRMGVPVLFARIRLFLTGKVGVS